MNVSKAGIDFIKKFEGFSAKAYKDPAGILTIGYGFTEDVEEGDTMTLEEAERLLAELVNNKYAKQVENALEGALRVPTQEEFDAMVSFTYNLGLSAFVNSWVSKYYILGDYLLAAGEILYYNKAYIDGSYKILNGLTARRRGEYKMFLKGLFKTVISGNSELWNEIEQMQKKLHSENNFLRSLFITQ